MTATPSMPVPGSLVNVSAGDVPIRQLLATVANALGGPIADHARGARTDTVTYPDLLTDPDARRTAIVFDRRLREAIAALDDAIDGWDVLFPPPTEPVGDFP